MSQVWAGWELFTAIHARHEFGWDMDVVALYFMGLFGFATVLGFFNSRLMKRWGVQDRNLMLVPNIALSLQKCMEVFMKNSKL